MLIREERRDRIFHAVALPRRRIQGVTLRPTPAMATPMTVDMSKITSGAPRIVGPLLHKCTRAAKRVQVVWGRFSLRGAATRHPGGKHGDRARSQQFFLDPGHAVA
jgi:hypothetical protein